MGEKLQKKGDAQLPAPADLLNDMFAEAGQGMEQAASDDYAIPFLHILQSLSPQLDEASPKFIDAARAGDIVDSVSGDMFKGKEGLLVVPCHFEKVYNEWVPRDSGGGFVASYSSKEEAMEHVGEGNQLQDTANHYILYYDPTTAAWRQAVLSCTSTKLKASRQWLTKLSMLKVGGPNGTFTPPTYGTIWRLGAQRTENQKGVFYNIDLNFVQVVDTAELFAAAKKFRDAVQGGIRRVELGGKSEEESTKAY